MSNRPLTYIGLGNHISVAYGCHGDNSPPQPYRYRREVVTRVVLYPLGVVDQRSEHHYAEYQEEYQQRELVRRSFERLDENLETPRVTRQFEQSHDSDDREKLEDVVLLLEFRQQEVEVEAQRRHHIDDVDGGLDEVVLVMRHDEADDDLEREPRIARALEVEERHVGFGSSLHQLPEYGLGEGVARGLTRGLARGLEGRVEYTLVYILVSLY